MGIQEPLPLPRKRGQRWQVTVWKGETRVASAENLSLRQARETAKDAHARGLRAELLPWEITGCASSPRNTPDQKPEALPVVLTRAQQRIVRALRETAATKPVDRCFASSCKGKRLLDSLTCGSPECDREVFG